MNTQHIKELEESQNYVISKWNATLLSGIKQGNINTEDGNSYTTIMGNFNKEDRLQFAQELANQMDIKILVNRIDSWYKRDESVIHLIYDLNPNNINDDSVPKNKKLDIRMGLEIYPNLTKKLKL